MAIKSEWTSFAYQPYQFHNVADFGIPASVQNEYTGESKSVFKSLCKLHYARKNQTITDRFQVAGTDYEDTIMIIIRHNKDLALQPVVFVKIDDKLYKCINYSVNNDTYNSVDLLTLKHVSKVG